METKLNDNEVREIAKMQKEIDSYKGFIGAIFIMAKSKECVRYPVFDDIELTHEMNFIWKFVKEHIQ
jgi:exonuclease V gamma subunit